MDIFDKDEFTLKELCYYFINKINKISFFKRLKIHNDVLNVCTCYILFSSNNKKYRKYLNNARINQCYIYIKNNDKLSIIKILQYFDFDFNKLIVRINVEKNDYDIKISWKKLYERYKNTDDETIKKKLKTYFFNNELITNN